MGLTDRTDQTVAEPPTSAERKPAELLRLDTLVFVYRQVRVRWLFIPDTADALLEQHILDADGNEVGRVTEEPPTREPSLRPAGTPTVPVRAAVWDSDGTRVVAFGTSHHWSATSLEVDDGAGRRVGTVTRKRLDGGVTFADAEGAWVATSRSAGVWGDFLSVISDVSGTEVGWVAGPLEHAARLARREGAVAPGRLKMWWRSHKTRNRHLLAITDDVSPDLRLLMIAASAGFDAAGLGPYD